MPIRNIIKQISLSVPFAYSRNNKDLKNLNGGQTYEGDGCENKIKCGGECMDQTFLEVSWFKCDDEIHAHTHLSKGMII